MQGSKVQVKMILNEQELRQKMRFVTQSLFYSSFSHCPIYFLGQEMKVGWTGWGMGKGHPAAAVSFHVPLKPGDRVEEKLIEVG